MLGDLDYKLCETALMELFATHTYPPQISEIREKCAEYTVPHLKDQGEAWGEVQKAISQYGYYRQEEALESLTPIVREAVRRLGFREICLDENQDAVRAHFFKIYSTLIERKTNDAKLPPSILEAKNKYIAQLTTHDLPSPKSMSISKRRLKMLFSISSCTSPIILICISPSP